MGPCSSVMAHYFSWWNDAPLQNLSHFLCVTVMQDTQDRACVCGAFMSQHPGCSKLNGEHTCSVWLAGWCLCFCFVFLPPYIFVPASVQWKTGSSLYGVCVKRPTAVSGQLAAPLHSSHIVYKVLQRVHRVFFRTVSTTQPGTDANAAKRVITETRPRGRAEFARAHSACPRTGRNRTPPNSFDVIKSKSARQELNHDPFVNVVSVLR